MSKCLVCENSIDSFISFGKMPIANGFLTPDQIKDEFFFELKTGFCEKCSMVQLTELVDQEKMFHENYAFFSSTSTRMAEHFKGFAKYISGNYLKSISDPFVVELGSNDGIMLQNFANAGVRHLGVEPSANVAAVAQSKGVKTISKFFDKTLAKEIVAENGKADAIMAANVICHIPYLHSVIDGFDALLSPKGVISYEDPYMGDIIQKTSYDQIYDEHAFYFSVTSVSKLFAQHGFELIDVDPQNVHGGSMRYVIARKGAHPISARVGQYVEQELKQGLDKPETYVTFRKNVEKSKTDLMELLWNMKKAGKRVVGYGATSKSTTVTNYCGITPDLVEFISDTTPIKQGKLSPGAHIPVKPYADFSSKYPEYALLFAWNHGGEIMEKEQAFVKNGGRFIVYVPKVSVL